MSTAEESNKPIHFRAKKHFVEELERYKGIHKITDTTEALHAIFEEWIVLTEQQKAYVDDSKPLKKTFDVPCDYRSQDDKGKPFCRNRKAPIITKFLMPEACEACLRLRVMDIDTVYGYCNVCQKQSSKTVLHENIPKAKCNGCGTINILKLA